MAAGRSNDAYLEQIERARAERNERLHSEDGWLTIVGLAWLQPGENTFGSARDNAIELPDREAPAHVGTFDLVGDQVLVRRDGIDTPMLDDQADGGPTVLQVGRLRLTVIRRDGGTRVGIRMKDPSAPTRRAFAGVETFPVDRRWNLRGRFERYDPPRAVLMPTFLDYEEPDEIHGALIFELDRVTSRLDASQSDDGSLSIAFTDETNGHETYAAGRYLEVDPPDRDGGVVIDFNASYNPPCIFTAYATCPLPLPQNRLPFRVEAGERAWGH
jgi:uncharacterized protein (DUF1684 family)